MNEVVRVVSMTELDESVVRTRVVEDRLEEDAPALTDETLPETWVAFASRAEDFLLLSPTPSPTPSAMPRRASTRAMRTAIPSGLFHHGLSSSAYSEAGSSSSMNGAPPVE